MKYLLIISLPGLLLLNSCHFFRERGLFLNREKALKEIKSQEKLMAHNDTLKQYADTLKTYPTDSVLVTTITETNKVADTPEHQFMIIVGSFGNIKNAEQALDKYKKQGFSAEIIKPPNKNKSILISIFAFDTREKADQQLQVVKSTIDKDAWVYTRRNR